MANYDKASHFKKHKSKPLATPLSLKLNTLSAEFLRESISWPGEHTSLEKYSDFELKALINRTLPVVNLHAQVTEELISRLANNDNNQNILKCLRQLWQQFPKQELTESLRKDVFDFATDILKELFVFANSCQRSQKNNPISKSIQNKASLAPDDECMDTECCFENSMNKDGEKWYTITEAAKNAGRDSGVISRWAKDGKIHSTTEGRKKLVYFPDVLYMNFKVEQKKLKKDFEEYRVDVQKIPDEH